MPSYFYSAQFQDQYIRRRNCQSPGTFMNNELKCSTNAAKNRMHPSEWQFCGQKCRLYKKGRLRIVRGVQDDEGYAKSNKHSLQL